MDGEDGRSSPILKPHTGREGSSGGAASPTQESAALLLAGFATSEDRNDQNVQSAGMGAPSSQLNGMLPRRPESMYAGSFSAGDRNAPFAYGYQSSMMPGDAAASAAAAVHQAMSAVQMEQTKLVMDGSDGTAFKRRRRPPNPPIRRRQRVCAVMTTPMYANEQPPVMMAHRPPQPESMSAQQYQQVSI